MAMDGAWVRANHGNSYFALSVEPGEHHVCVTLQSSLVAQRVELAHFTAEAEKSITTAHDSSCREVSSCYSLIRSTAIKANIWLPPFR